MLSENWIVFHIGDHLPGKFPGKFKPLRTFPPIGYVHGWAQPLVVAAAGVGSWIIKGPYEALLGVDEVVVDGCEIEYGNACFRE